MENRLIERSIFREFKEKVIPNKVLILLGARRTGKTILINQYLQSQNSKDFLFLNGDDQSTIDAFSSRTEENFKRLLGEKNLLVIDEAQSIPEIDLKLKIIVDKIPGVSVIATGSSVFDLSNKLGEPLVGRENTLRLFPLSQLEFSQQEDFLETKERLEERLIFGGYPELQHLSGREEKISYLEGLVNSSLLRDILGYNGIKKADKIMDLLRLIAFQIGKEISLDELANSLKGLSRNTVESYLDLLSKVFIVYKVDGFSRNLRKEITKTSRWYFYDNGIRNAIIRNFNPLKLRADSGDLWENYVMIERIKFLKYTKRRVNHYFWRTYDQQELDLVEEESGELRAYEFKWSSSKKFSIPGAWKKNYPDAHCELINPENYLSFITDSKF